MLNTAIKPKLAFLGTGWIGINRMKALLAKELCIPLGVCDISASNIGMAKETAAGLMEYTSIDEIVKGEPDGIVIATPNALHYSQCMMALTNGIPVFCQKPLARTHQECREIVNAAQKADKLLGVDMSYRFTDGMQKIYNLIRNNDLGEVYSADLVFHNAYGPDKEWFYNPRLSGGGCVIDLGIHLVDLALWILDFPKVSKVTSALYSGGKLISIPAEICEDFASVQIETENGSTIRLTCSWNLPAGKDAEIKAAFYGTKAAAVFENINGSFYDFQAFLCHGTSRQVISSPPDDWGAEALVSWVNELSRSSSFNTEISNHLKVADIIDMIYGRTTAI